MANAKDQVRNRPITCLDSTASRFPSSPHHYFTFTRCHHFLSISSQDQEEKVQTDANKQVTIRNRKKKNAIQDLLLVI